MAAEVVGTVHIWASSPAVAEPPHPEVEADLVVVFVAAVSMKSLCVGSSTLAVRKVTHKWGNQLGLEYCDPRKYVDLIGHFAKTFLIQISTEIWSWQRLAEE